MKPSPGTRVEIVWSPRGPVGRSSSVRAMGTGSVGLLACLVACQPDPVTYEGEFGRAIALASGTPSIPPFFMFIDEGCPGPSAAGGCEDPSRPCRPLLLDSLAGLSAVRDSTATELSFGEECLEVRSAAGMAATDPTRQARAAAVTRFRVLDVPTLRAPASSEEWTWQAGNATQSIEVGGVLGGNALNDGAVAIRWPRDAGGQASFYVEYPGSEQALADQGRAAIPVQFPGRLLGREIIDRCLLDDDRECTVDAINPDLRFFTANEPTRMVLDACIAVPPCRVHYHHDRTDPESLGACSTLPGFDTAERCTPIRDALQGGHPASLLVATGVPGLVLFEDSAARMFGDLAALPSCNGEEGQALETQACLEGNEGALYVPGWRPAGDPAWGDPPLQQLRVRSLALVPGLRQSRGIGPCERAEQRFEALTAQCEAYTSALVELRYPEDTTPPYAPPIPADPGASLAVLGEAHFESGQMTPQSDRWLSTLVVPADHPLALVLRRDVSPEAIEPDGLLGTALFQNLMTVLDYTDSIPAVRVGCLDPRSGDCLVAPLCTEDGSPSCCYGLPLDMLVEFIITGDDETCCVALSPSELLEIQGDGYCLSTIPP